MEDAIAYCREFGIYVNVLGLPLDEHQTLAAETGGKWHVIPEEPQPQVAQRTNVKKTPAKQSALPPQRAMGRCYKNRQRLIPN